MVKGFQLDGAGDVQILNNEIQMIDGNDLLRQTVEAVLSTNKGEWFLNEQEGITFANILGKLKDEEIVRNEVQQGLLQVDSSFVLTSFTVELDKLARKLQISFTAVNAGNEVVSGAVEYA